MPTTLTGPAEERTNCNANLSVVLKYEQLQMTPEQIAIDENLELLAVKAILMQNSGKYRHDCKVNHNLEFSDEQHKDAIKTIYRLMMSTEDENLKGRLACYIRDDKKGRRDNIPNSFRGMNINILSFNEDLRKAMSACVDVATLENKSIEAEVVVKKEDEDTII